MTVSNFSALHATREEKWRGASSRPVCPGGGGRHGSRYVRYCREEVTGPNVVCGGGNTREEVGIAAFHTAQTLRGG